MPPRAVGVGIKRISTEQSNIISSSGPADAFAAARKIVDGKIEGPGK
jgi:hypothetical protein